jgi:Rad3-related DNA helicase
MLGAKDTDPVLQLPSPFDPAHFQVMVTPYVDTTLKKREATAQEVASYISQFIEGKMGNYLVFFPSYRYLSLVENVLSLPANIRVLSQKKAMTDEEKAAFLDAFNAIPQQTTLGLAVLGGGFSEGIDLVADRLIGVGIVSVGLPSLSFQRDLMMQYFKSETSSGFAFAYAYPAMNKVLQALGRVIRSESDRGVALLIDRRFLSEEYASMMHRYPTINRIYSPQDCLAAVLSFFKHDSM